MRLAVHLGPVLVALVKQLGPGPLASIHQISGLLLTDNPPCRVLFREHGLLASKFEAPSPGHEHPGKAFRCQRGLWGIRIEVVVLPGCEHLVGDDPGDNCGHVSALAPGDGVTLIAPQVAEEGVAGWWSLSALFLERPGI